MCVPHLLCPFICWQVVFISWLLWIMLQLPGECRYPFDICVLFPLGILPRSAITELLDHMIVLFLNFFLIFYLFLEREEGREKEKARNINVWLPLACPPLGSWPTTGMCPDWELNQRPFGSQASAQSTEPYQPGLFLIFWGTSILFFIVVIPVYIPTNSAQGFPCLHTLTNPSHLSFC